MPESSWPPSAASSLWCRVSSAALTPRIISTTLGGGGPAPSSLRFSSSEHLPSRPGCRQYADNQGIISIAWRNAVTSVTDLPADREESSRHTSRHSFRDPLRGQRKLRHRLNGLRAQREEGATRGHRPASGSTGAARWDLQSRCDSTAASRAPRAGCRRRYEKCRRPRDAGPTGGGQ